MSAKLTDVLIAVVVYVMLVGAGVLMGAPDLAGFAFLTILPLSLLVGLRRDLPLKRKLGSVGLLWYVLPIVVFVLLAASDPGRIVYFLVGTLCLMIFFVCFGCLIKLYWVQRG